MLRFFRQIRQRLLTENRFSKYLLYAVGEILLVVIGILIALQVDNWNNERNNDEKVRSILSDIMDELVLNIEKTNNIMQYYAWRDSAFYLVLNNRVSIEDYEQNEIPNLFSLTSFYDRVDLTQDSYSILSQNSDIIPHEYKGVFEKLTQTNNIDKKWVDQFDEELGDFTKEIQRNLMNNYPWFSNTDPSDMRSQIEYMFNDFRYKNEVREFRNLGIGNQLRFTLRYRRKAIECYKELAQLLNRPTNNEAFDFNQETSKDLIGDWEVLGDPETIFSFIEVDKRLYAEININSRRYEVFWLPPHRILLDNLNFGSLVKNGEEHLIKFNSFELKRVR